MKFYGPINTRDLAVIRVKFQIFIKYGNRNSLRMVKSIDFEKLSNYLHHDVQNNV